MKRSFDRQSIRRLLMVVAIGLGGTWTMAAHAQTPQTPVRILVGFAAGGGVDALARLLAVEMSAALGQPVVVDNRPGAGGLLAAMALKNAAADGNTLLLTNDHTLAVLPHTLKSAGFDTAKDFRPVGLISSSVALGLAVNVDTKMAQLKDLPEWARQHPDKTSIGVPASGSIPEFAVAVISKQLNVDAVPVPYRGGAPMVVDLVSGQIPIGMTGLTELTPHHKANKIRVLAVTGPGRSPWLPDVPTFSELGIKGFELANVVGLYAPAATPSPIIQRYGEVLRTVLQSDATRVRLEGMGIPARYGSPEELNELMQKISTTWGGVIQRSGYKPQ